jgi:hypothetical protein
LHRIAHQRCARGTAALACALSGVSTRGVALGERRGKGHLLTVWSPVQGIARQRIRFLTGHTIGSEIRTPWDQRAYSSG